MQRQKTEIVLSDVKINAMNKFIFKSRTCKITFYSNLAYLAVYRNAMIVGKLSRPHTRTELLLLALSANKSFRQLRGSDRVTITIFDSKHFDELYGLAGVHFPNAYINK